MFHRPGAERRTATMDVCLGGVFIGRGESIPVDLLPAWERRLAVLGIVGQPRAHSDVRRAPVEHRD